MKKAIFTIFSLLISLYAPAQHNYYVSPTGNNSNNGSFASAWHTIQYACDQLQAKDTLNILAGTYAEKVNLNVSGNSGEMITIRAYQNQNVIVDAASFSNGDAIFFAENKSNIRVEGIHFTNNYNLDGAGFYVIGAGENWEVINCKFSKIAISTDPNHVVTYDTNMPVLLFTGMHATDSLSGILIDGNEVFDCRPGYSECIAVGGNLSGFTISNNHVYNNANIGIAVGGNYKDSPTAALDHARYGLIKNNICSNNNADYSTAAGIYVDGGEHVLVENNTCYQNGYGGEIGCEEAGNCSYITFRNNIFYKNEQAGMHVGGYDVNTGGYVEFSKVLNNTFYHNDTQNAGNGEIMFTQFENGEVSNNLFYLSSQNFFISNDRSQPNLTMDYNLIYCESGISSIKAYWDTNDLFGLPSIYGTLGIGTNDSFGNPYFTDAANANFHIAANSAAIDAGNPNYIPASGEVDMDNENRIYNAIIDCGSDEYTSGTAVAEVFEHHIKVYPNPSSGLIFIEGNDISSLEIVDISGTLIKSYRNKIPTSIDLSKQKKGVYILKIVSKGFSRTEKFVLH